MSNLKPLNYQLTMVAAIIGALILLSTLLTSDGCSTAIASPHLRPLLITEALAADSSVYYIGVGSNMLKEKVATRGAGITFTSFEPARVVDHRLAFNMRGEYSRVTNQSKHIIFLI